MIYNVLSIAGSDPSGGAGIQADLKTFSALGCYGMAVITALTAQNTQGVSGVHVPPSEFTGAQIDAIFKDIRVDAVKIGMLANAGIVGEVANKLQTHDAKNIVVDPVLVATSGDSLGDPDVVDAMIEKLFPLATLITPNLPEAHRLIGAEPSYAGPDLKKMAEQLSTMGCASVLVKGGHQPGDNAIDLLWADGEAATLSAERIDTDNTHGTGCTLSSAIAAYLAKGHKLHNAVNAAKVYLTEALKASDRLQVGKISEDGAPLGHGPVHHFHGFH